MRRSTGLHIAAAMIAVCASVAGGCSQRDEASSRRSAEATASASASNDANGLANALQLLLLATGDRPLQQPEPRGDLDLNFPGMFAAVISTVTVEPASVSFDTLTYTGSSSETHPWAVNRYSHVQSAAVASTAVVLLQSTSSNETDAHYGGENMVGLTVLTFEEFARRFGEHNRPDDEPSWPLYFMAADSNSVLVIAELYSP